MGYLLAAAAITAVGAGVSASGASKNAKAMKSAQKKVREAEEIFGSKWQGNLSSMIDEKEEKLYNLGNIFDRFESTGAFGDTDTLKNLRKAQSDFSALAAGDFTAFNAQLNKTLSDSLVNTVGSGAPVGTFAGLAADAQMNYRLQGVQTASGISEFLGAQAQNLLGLEFGVMDQGFQIGYDIDRTRQNNVNAARLGAAQTEGVGLAAWGGAIQQVGSTVGSLGSAYSARGAQQQSFALQQQQLGLMEFNRNAGVAPRATPVGGGSSAYVSNYSGGGSIGGYNLGTGSIPELPRTVQGDGLMQNNPLFSSSMSDNDFLGTELNAPPFSSSLFGTDYGTLSSLGYSAAYSGRPAGSAQVNANGTLTSAGYSAAYGSASGALSALGARIASGQ